MKTLLHVRSSLFGDHGQSAVLAADFISTWQTRHPGARVIVQIRAHGEPMDAAIDVTGDRVVAHLDEPARGVAPGQAMAMYDGTRVIGSATIVRR